MVHQGSVLFYFLFPFLSVLLAIKSNGKSIVGLYILVFMLLFSMFRGENVGNDTKSYLNNYVVGSAIAIDGMVELGEYEDGFGKQVEILSRGIAWVTVVLELPNRTLISAYSLIQMLFLYYALRRMKINVALGLALYILFGYYFFSLSAARQMAAVSVVIYGVTFLFENTSKRYLFFFFIIIATTIHASALFYIWLYLLRNIKVNRKMLSSIMLVACAIGVFTSINIMDYIFRVIDLPYVTRYMGSFGGTVRTSLLSRLSDLIKYGFFLYVFNLRSGNGKCDLFDTLFTLAVVLWAVFSHTDGMLSRISDYQTPFVAFFIAKVIKEEQLLKNKQFNPFFLLFIFIWMIGMRSWAEALRSGYYLMFL